MGREIKQVYFHYEFWEEYHSGMWRTEYGETREFYLQKAIEFTGNTNLYGKFMMEVIKAWPYSCLVNMTNPSMNHQAWVGHAACCLAIKCPEDITRLAWGHLTQEQQDKANAKADLAIESWRNTYVKKGIQLCLIRTI